MTMLSTSRDKELRQSTPYANYVKSIGWQVETHTNGTKAYIRKIPYIGVSVIKIQRVEPSKIDSVWITKLAKKHRALTTYIELYCESTKQNKQDISIQSLLNKNGFTATKSGLLPTKTLILDLTKNKKALLANMKPKTRYNIGLTKKTQLKIIIKDGHELLKDKELHSHFYKLIKQNGQRKSTYTMPKEHFIKQLKAFGKECFVVMAYPESEHTLIAGAVFLTTKNTAYYQHNGSTLQGRKLMGPTRVIWEAILEAKNRKCESLDFDGIYDERFPLKRWQGFTRFKKSFGGNTVSYPPALRKFLWR